MVGVCLGEVKGEEERVRCSACGVFDRNCNLTPTALYVDDVTIPDVFALCILGVDFEEIS